MTIFTASEAPLRVKKWTNFFLALILCQIEKPEGMGHEKTKLKIKGHSIYIPHSGKCKTIIKIIRTGFK